MPPDDLKFFDAKGIRWIDVSHDMVSRYKTILALDVGDVRVGVAMSAGVLAAPLEIIKRDAHTIDNIKRLVDLHGIELILVGLPYNMDGTIGFQGKKTQRFADKLTVAVAPVPVEMEDERESTEQARELRLARGKGQKARKSRIDAEAAAIFLQAYLDRQGVSL